jgi:ribosomal protein L7/L12
MFKQQENEHGERVQTTAQEQAKRAKLDAECRALIAAGKRVEAVKKYRTATGCSLPEAQRQLGMK